MVAQKVVESMLFVGDDWAEDHHDLEILDAEGTLVRRGRVAEGVEGISEFGRLVSMASPEGSPEEVAVCIEVDSGPWVNALIAAGYRVYGVDPKQARRYRETLASSGAKSDRGDAHALADMVRTRHRQMTPTGGDSDNVEAVKVLARAQQSMVWERTRHMLRLRAALRLYFPAVLVVCAEFGWELTSRPVMGLLAMASTPEDAAEVRVPQLVSLMYRCRNKDAKAVRVHQILREPRTGMPVEVTAAYAASVTSTVAVLQSIAAQLEVLEAEVGAHFSRHPAAEIYLSQPGAGMIVGPRLLGEFGDDPNRFRGPKARKNYAGTSPITIQSGKMRIVAARFLGNDRVLDAAIRQANAAMINDPDAKAYYDKQRARGVEHNAALRQLANKLVGILHGCLARGVVYDPEIAWSEQRKALAA